MSFRDRDDKIVTGVHKSVASAELARGDTGELVTQLSFPEQQSFPDTGALTAVSTPKKPTSVATASDPSMMPGSTQSKLTTTSVRMPIVIPGSGKPKAVATRPALKRRMVVHGGWRWCYCLSLGAH
ncbi:hypothetical protein [Dictyobacter halimunensis]|uniref:hypothetical protein n=1 Tax=Dictyobacter halimunensis TaxID=3026934 RepID=UPI0030C725C3